MTGRHRFFLRWLARSLRRSLASGAIATASLALCAAVVFCLVAVSGGVEAQLGRELRAYGANVVLLPRQAPLRFGLGAYELGAIPEERSLPVAALRAVPADLADAVAPALLLRVTAAGQEVGAAGFAFDALRLLAPAWKVTPGWPREPTDAVAGARAAERLGLAPGMALEVAGAAGRARVSIAAVVETGGPEDDDLLLPLPLAQELAGRPGEASLALVRARLGARGADAEASARALEAAVPGSEARTLRQVARAEAALLETVKRLLAFVALAIAAATAFTVAGTMGVLLLARRQELGLCLALGASAAELRRLLLAEAGVTGAAGAAAGCAAGAAAAEAIALSVFGTLVPIGAAPTLLAAGAALALALAASAYPVARAVAESPCDTLRAP